MFVILSQYSWEVIKKTQCSMGIHNSVEKVSLQINKKFQCHIDNFQVFVHPNKKPNFIVQANKSYDYNRPVCPLLSTSPAKSVIEEKIYN